MTITALDPKLALVIIDLQNGIVAMPTVHPIAEIIARSAALARAFREAGHAVVLVNVDGGAPGRTAEPRRSLAGAPAGFADLVPELDAQPSDLRITKQRWGAFHGTALDAELKARGVTQIVLAGVATSIGVESTARFASEYGYNVVPVTDAMTDRSPEAHENSITRIFPRLGEPATTAEVLALLAR